jgi:hypothetical protein
LAHELDTLRVLGQKIDRSDRPVMRCHLGH